MEATNSCVVAVVRMNSRGRQRPLEPAVRAHLVKSNKLLCVGPLLQWLHLISFMFSCQLWKLTCWTLCLAVDSSAHQSCFLQFLNWQEPEVARERTGLNHAASTATEIINATCKKDHYDGNESNRASPVQTVLQSYRHHDWKRTKRAALMVMSDINTGWGGEGVGVIWSNNSI